MKIATSIPVDISKTVNKIKYLTVMCRTGHISGHYAPGLVFSLGCLGSHTGESLIADKILVCFLYHFRFQSHYNFYFYFLAVVFDNTYSKSSFHVKLPEYSEMGFCIF